MASTENINMEMYTGDQQSSDTAPFWIRIKQQINPGKHSVTEYVLVAVVFLLFIIVIALAATHGGVGVKPADQVCESESCLYRSGYLVGLMNRSVNPCEDFYNYACGATSLVYPINPSLRERTIIGELKRQNEDKLETILRSPVIRNTADSFERKIKTFFAKCVDDFIIERVKGSVLTMLLRPDFYVMNASSVDNFDITRMLASTYNTFGAPALFKYTVEANPMDGNKYTIAITNGGIGMLPVMYVSDFYTKQRDAYRTYIRTVAQQLVSDAEPGTIQSGAQERIEDFVLDVMEIETELANITRTAAIPDPNMPPVDPENQVSLLDMNNLYGPIQWTNFFINLLQPNAQESTKVIVQEADYLNRTMTYVRDKLVILHPTDYKRKLSNYMNWQIISSFTGDLSSSYVHAKREFESTLSSSNYIYENRFDYCFERTKSYMLGGLSSLFVADHLVDAGKEAVDKTYKVFQGELLSGIDRLQWIAQADRELAKAKVRAIVDKIGYSNREVGDSYLDEYYRDFRSDSSDYLLDMSISWQNFNRLKLGSLLGTKLNKADWTGATFDVALTMSTAAELTIPAGALQWPFFTKQLPNYINYATIGQRMASELIKSIDATGQITDKDGNINPMWSVDTLFNYVTKAECVNTTFAGLRAGPYIAGNRTYYVDIDQIIVRTLRYVIADTDGLRMAARAYAGSQSASTEQPLPLGHLNNMQAFYVSWAQTFCYTRDPLYSYIRGYLLRTMPEEIHVNGILSLLPEFAQSFQCPSGAKMVKREGCDPIFYQ